MAFALTVQKPVYLLREIQITYLLYMEAFSLVLHFHRPLLQLLICLKLTKRMQKEHNMVHRKQYLLSIQTTLHLHCSLGYLWMALHLTTRLELLQKFGL